jgi:hypothetical protein
LFFGLRLSSTPTSPNWNEPSISTTLLPSSVAAAIARLTAIVVRPTPPFGEKTATTWPSWSPPSSIVPLPPPPVETTTGAVARRLCFSRSRA